MNSYLVNDYIIITHMKWMPHLGNDSDFVYNCYRFPKSVDEVLGQVAVWMLAQPFQGQHQLLVLQAPKLVSSELIE
jgi:hypothetical protein